MQENNEYIEFILSGDIYNKLNLLKSEKSLERNRDNEERPYFYRCSCKEKRRLNGKNWQTPKYGCKT